MPKKMWQKKRERERERERETTMMMKRKLFVDQCRKRW